MSEIINNQEERQQKLKALIKRLHAGEDEESVQVDFKKDFAYVSGAEIAEMERNLVEEGLPVEEIQNLCNIHASLFKGSIQEMHSEVLTVNPLKEFENFNEHLLEIIAEMEDCREAKPNDLNKVKTHLTEKLAQLKLVEAHYSKKENVLFPFLEAAGVSTIPQVMWGVQNNIRASIRKEEALLENSQDIIKIKDFFFATLDMINDMITKEKNILFPMLRDTFRAEEWKQISAILEGNETSTAQEPPHVTTGNIPMTAGALSQLEINSILNTIPFDMTFVDADNKVKYVTQGKERVFDRPASVIGRPVHLCHPPQSVHVVLDIIEDLRSGKKDHEDFWINFKGMFAHIRYYAVRNDLGQYLGVLEVTQDVKPIRELQGEKRLVEK